MKYSITFAPLMVVLLATPPALAAEHNAGAQAGQTVQRAASISFANRSVRNWVAEGDQVVYFEDNDRNWYRAVLFAPSHDLAFAQAIGFDTQPMGSLDKWSTLVIRGQRYPLQSFERVDGPPAKADKAHKAQPHT